MGEKKKTKLPLIDRLLQEALAATREEASKAILAGLVKVNDEVVDKVGAVVSSDAVIRFAVRKEFVSRAAKKLEAAFESFPISVTDKTCADVGACTGGFTEILLQRGAGKVYAIDVGYGDLDWKIRSDPRVVVMERTNARYLETLGEQVSCVTIDVSFISLSKILPAVVRWLAPKADIVALIKPQFEAEREEIGPGGIVTDSGVHERVVQRVRELLPSLGLTFRGLEPSPILGAEGNKEFLLWAQRD
jgi:23S rRNA (cytidine1920-2'-O)/16S rRNA (cytidine1409-2'-O)-methyltransferase